MELSGGDKWQKYKCQNITFMAPNVMNLMRSFKIFHVSPNNEGMPMIVGESLIEDTVISTWSLRLPRLKIENWVAL